MVESVLNDLFIDQLSFLTFEQAFKRPGVIANEPTGELVYCNRARVYPKITGEELEDLKKFYQGFGWTAWIPSTDTESIQRVKQAGLVYETTFPVMVVNLKAVAQYTESPDPAIDVRRITDQHEILTTWVSLAAAAFNMDGKKFRKYIELLLQSKDAHRAHFYLGFYQGQPVATSFATKQDNILAVHWVGTLPDFRRRGIGFAVSHFPLDDLRDGADWGILYASTMGKSVYEKIGFIEQVAVDVYLYLPSTRESTL
jgi:GNAT superfamily N-acetyltransferase